MYQDDELRHLAISLLRAETDRDKQTRVGASDLANQCDRCLAMKLAGVRRPTPPQADRVWLGAVLGTAIHGELESRIARNTSDPNSPLLEALIGAYAETHTTFGHILGYGDVGGTIDFSLPDQIVDWKGSTRKKSCLLQDFLALTKGEQAPFGRTHRLVKLSEKEYAEEMDRMVYKMNGYFAQQTLYMRGRELSGRSVSRGSIIWINRDGNGYFDLPHGSRYEDPTAVHDIWTLSFDYSQEEALKIIARGQRIFDRLNRHTPADTDFSTFDSHEYCWTCSHEEKAREDALDIVATMGTAA